MPRLPINYLNTVIYKIVCNDLSITGVYVGHTTNFKERKANHKKTCYDENYKKYNYKVYQTIRENGGWNNWSILEICKYPCNSFQEAVLEERRHYELLNANLNVNYPGRTPREYCEQNKDIIIERNKIYREENRDIISERRKIYYEENRDEISERRKIYYEENRDEILEKHKIYYEENKDIILEKAKIYYEENKDKQSEYDKKYREKNREVLLEYSKMYYDKNRVMLLEKYKKEKCTCQCGSTIRVRDKSKHEKSIKHIQFMQNNNLCEIVNPESINV
jgi:hypothetical protein